MWKIVVLFIMTGWAALPPCVSVSVNSLPDPNCTEALNGVAVRADTVQVMHARSVVASVVYADTARTTVNVSDTVRKVVEQVEYRKVVKDEVPWLTRRSVGTTAEQGSLCALVSDLRGNRLSESCVDVFFNLAVKDFSTRSVLVQVENLRNLDTGEEYGGFYFKYNSVKYVREDQVGRVEGARRLSPGTDSESYVFGNRHVVITLRPPKTN